MDLKDKNQEESSQEEKEDEDKKPSEPPKTPPTAVKQALSPAVAECQRAIFAAFLWQEILYDAMASATFLKFCPELMKELRHVAAGSLKETEKEDEEKRSEEQEVRKDEESVASGGGGKTIKI